MEGTYRNMNQAGVSTSATMNPRNIMLDIDEKIRTYNPEDTPLQSLATYLGVGPKPKNHKIEVIQYYSYDNFDYATDTCFGVEGTGPAGISRYGAIRPAQKTRPFASSTNMYYHAQDKFYIVNTGQVVEVVLTPNSEDRMPTSMGATGSSSNFTLPTYIATQTGSTTTAVTSMTAGWLGVRNIENAPLIPFTKSDIVYLGRTIYESQNIEGKSSYRDIVFDSNYVEHKEKVLIMSEDQKNFIKTKTNALTWEFEQQEMIAEFKKEVEYSLMFGERAVEYDVDHRPTYHMRGLMHAINENVAYYNPYTTDNMEKLVSNFIFQHGFRYVPNKRKKIALCGDTFIYNFNQAFKDFRRTTDIDVKAKKIGIDISSYYIPGGYEIQLVATPFFRHDTPLEHYCAIIDPGEMELRLVNDYKTTLYSAPYERDAKLAIDWKGSIAFHRTAAFALLKPFGNF